MSEFLCSVLVGLRLQRKREFNSSCTYNYTRVGKAGKVFRHCINSIINHRSFQKIHFSALKHTNNYNPFIFLDQDWGKEGSTHTISDYKKLQVIYKKSGSIQTNTFSVFIISKYENFKRNHPGSPPTTNHRGLIAKNERGGHESQYCVISYLQI